jgi:hypothetical protein
MSTQNLSNTVHPSIQDVTVLLKTWSYKEDPSGVRLRAFDTEHLTKVLTDIITSENEMKYQAANALMSINSRHGVDILLPLLDNPHTSSEMRHEICGLMSMFGDERAFEPLTRRLLYDPEGNVRAIAAFALGEIGDENVLPNLRWAQEHDQGTDFEGTPIKLLVQEAIDELLQRRSSSSSTISHTID